MELWAVGARDLLDEVEELFSQDSLRLETDSTDAETETHTNRDCESEPKGDGGLAFPGYSTAGHLFTTVTKAR